MYGYYMPLSNNQNMGSENTYKCLDFFLYKMTLTIVMGSFIEDRQNDKYPLSLAHENRTHKSPCT